MTTAAVLGLDTAAGAYLARLLLARGVAVRGTGDGGLLEQLGVAGEVTRAESLANSISGADLIYDVRGDAGATMPLLDMIGDQRLLVAVDPADQGLIAQLAAKRLAGQYVATARVYPHESRLGPGTSPVARIVAALAGGTDPDRADLETATDCGWTAEYVEPLAQIPTQPAADDYAVATGRLLAGSDVARIAAAYFGRRQPAAARPSLIGPGAGVVPLQVPGWRAVTVGADLVEVLCEAKRPQRV